VKELLKSV